MNGYTTAIFGATSEIGQKLLDRLVEQGEDSFFITGRNINALNEFAKNTIAKHPNVSIVCKQFIIQQGNGICNLLDEITPEDLKINRLVYIIGVNYLSPALSITEEVWDTVFDANVKGFFFVAQHIAKQMVINEGGRIVAVSSQHGLKPNIDRSPYCSSKAALIMATKSLALELAKYNIQVNTVSPTFIINDNNSEILESRKFINLALNKIPAHKYAVADDVAESICFLLTSKTSMITGHSLLVDGGWSLN